MSPNEQAQRAAAERSGRARILVVEDNPLNRLLLHDILELRGHEVIEAASVDEALPLLDTARLDLLLLDVQIPGGGGEAVVKEVRKRAALADLPIVAVTSLAMPGDRERLLGSGFQGYLSKPIDTRTFGPTVEAFLAARGGPPCPLTRARRSWSSTTTSRTARSPRGTWSPRATTPCSPTAARPASARFQESRPGSGAARRGHAAHGRLRDLPPPARAARRPRRADPVPDRARRSRHAQGGARFGRRRLPHQADQPHRAPDPHALAAAHPPPVRRAAPQLRRDPLAARRAAHRAAPAPGAGDADRARPQEPALQHPVQRRIPDRQRAGSPSASASRWPTCCARRARCSAW